ncbi:MAG TPA: lipopolysaccharide biosynthesis protein [Thermoanaerobaculia bacterium]|nr:lipopolysaccharide biosynthesis protein [Thermoanaerobaculia bacterium]
MTAADDFGRTTARAVGWAFIATSGAKIVTLIGLTLLARLLAPQEFGLLAFALAYIVYVDTIADLGTGTALIYWPDRRDDAAQVTFLVNLAAGVFWCGLTFALAPFIAGFFNAPQGTPIVRALSLTFFIKYLGNTHDALTRKDLRFKAAAIPELAMATIKMGVAIALAWRGFGAWSLVWAHLAGLVAWTGLLWVVTPWRPSWKFPTDLFRPMLAYGRGIIFVNVLSAFQYQTDLVMISRWHGMTALGLYQLAGKIPEATVAMIYRVTGRVLLPAFSRAWTAGTNPNETYLVAARYVGAVTLPVACGLALLAEPFVLLFFGPKWVAAAPIVSALTVLAGIRALASHPGDVLKATGRVGLLARIGFLRVTLIVVAVVVAVRWSPLAVAVALVVVDSVALFLAFAATARAVGISLSAVGRAYAPGFTAAAGMSVALLAWMRWGPVLTPAAVGVIVPVVLGAVTYLLILHMTDRKILMEARWLLSARPSASPQ